MTVRTESRLIVGASVPDVWAYLCDVGRWAEWAPTVLTCRIRGGGELQPGGWIEQQARDFGLNHRRSEQVTAVDAPRSMAFAGTMWSSPARWGVQLERVDDAHTDTTMWVEVDLANVMRILPGRAFGRMIRRVSDTELAGIKAAVESESVRRAETS